MGQKMMNDKPSIYYEDCITGMREHVSDESVDLVIADPPFGIGFSPKDKGNYRRKSEFVVGGYQEAPDDYYGFTMEWMREAVRVMKDSGSMYLYSSWNNLLDVLAAADNYDLVPRGHLIWRRTFAPYKRWGWVTAHYHILYYTKYDGKDGKNQAHTFNKILKKHPTKDKMYHYPEDVLFHKAKYMPGELKNGTKLPYNQVKLLIETSSSPKDIVLDPFLGNGTTLDAAIFLNRRFVGFEINSQCEPIIDQVLNRYGIRNSVHQQT